MSDKILKNELKKLVLNSGFEKSTKMSCSLAKILKMRHKDIGREQISRVVSQVV